MHYQHTVGKLGAVSHKEPPHHVRRITLQPGIDFRLQIQVVVIGKQLDLHSLSPFQNL